MPSLPSPRAKTRPRLEIIPFIDIMFFLLATFMMVSLSMIKNEGIAVNLPSAATAGSEDRRSSVTISVTEDGDLFVDKNPVDMGQLRARLRALHAENRDLRVFVNGDDRADLGRAVEVLDEVRLLGIHKVAIQTRKRK